jgi:pseudaminic acid cytidylyltransferase
MRVIAIIPARGGSKRLPLKNIYPWHGKPLLAYSLAACAGSKYIETTFVSSDDAQILNVAKQYGGRPLLRPQELADDLTPKIVAIRQAAQDPDVGGMDANDLVVVVQANSPEMRAEDLDRGIELLLQHNLWEVMSADSNGVANAAFRIVRYHALFNEFLSAHCGFVIAKIHDVHTLADLHSIDQRRSSGSGL